MNRSRTIREATELNATQGGESMNPNQMTCEVTEVATSNESPLEFLTLVRSVTEARMGSPKGKVHAPGLAKRHGVPGSFVKDMAAALKPMSKADMKEFIALLDAALGGRCCYQEMVAAMLDVFGTKYNSHSPTVVILGVLALWALKDMGLPEGSQLVDLACHVASGGNRTKPVLAELMGEADATQYLRSEEMVEMLANPETLELLSPSTLVLERVSRTKVAPRFTAVAESAIARAAGLVVKAKVGHRLAEYAMPQIRRMIDGAGLSGLDAEFCTWLGSLTGEHLAGGIRSRIEHVAAASPWLAGARRARTAGEMMRDAAASAAA